MNVIGSILLVNGVANAKKKKAWKFKNLLLAGGALHWHIDIHQRTTQSDSLRRANCRRGCWEVNLVASSQGWVSFRWLWKLLEVPVFAGSLAGAGVDEGGGPWDYWCNLNPSKVLGLFSLCLKQDHRLCFLSVCVCLTQRYNPLNNYSVMTEDTGTTERSSELHQKGLV